MMPGRQPRKDLRALAGLARREALVAVYAFGSRAKEALEALSAGDARLQPSSSDLDIAVVAEPGKHLTVLDKVRIAQELEDLSGTPRVDLVVLPEADPFLAANIVRGERLYAADDHAADEYELYVLRRAGDLIPLERERQQLILGEEP